MGSSFRAWPVRLPCGANPQGKKQGAWNFWSSFCLSWIQQEDQYHLSFFVFPLQKNQITLICSRRSSLSLHGEIWEWRKRPFSFLPQPCYIISKYCHLRYFLRLEAGIYSLLRIAGIFLSAGVVPCSQFQTVDSVTPSRRLPPPAAVPDQAVSHEYGLWGSWFYRRAFGGIMKKLFWC